MTKTDEVLSDEEKLLQLRNNDELVAVVQFMSIFGPYLLPKLKQIDILEFEDELLGRIEPKYSDDLRMQLLHGASSNRSYKTTPDEYLGYLFRRRRPDDPTFGTEEEPKTWAELSVFEKAHVYRWLCEWQMNNPEKFKDRMNVIIKDEHMLLWRADPIGRDGCGRIYFLMDGNRLYRREDERVPAIDGVTPKRRKRLSKRVVDDEEEALDLLSKLDNGESVIKSFELICSDFETWTDFMENLSRSRNKNDKELYALLDEEVMPGLQQQQDKMRKEKERREKERLRDALVSHRKRSSRILVKEEQRRVREEQEREEARKQTLLKAERKKRAKEVAFPEAHRESLSVKTREERLRERELAKIHQEEYEKERELTKHRKQTQHHDKVTLKIVPHKHGMEKNGDERSQNLPPMGIFHTGSNTSWSQASLSSGPNSADCRSSTTKSPSRNDLPEFRYDLNTKPSAPGIERSQFSPIGSQYPPNNEAFGVSGPEFLQSRQFIHAAPLPNAHSYPNAPFGREKQQQHSFYQGIGGQMSNYQSNMQFSPSFLQRQQQQMQDHHLYQQKQQNPSIYHEQRPNIGQLYRPLPNSSRTAADGGTIARPQASFTSQIGAAGQSPLKLSRQNDKRPNYSNGSGTTHVDFFRRGTHSLALGDDRPSQYPVERPGSKKEDREHFPQYMVQLARPFDRRLQSEQPGPSNFSQVSIQPQQQSFSPVDQQRKQMIEHEVSADRRNSSAPTDRQAEGPQMETNSQYCYGSDASLPGTLVHPMMQGTHNQPNLPVHSLHQQIQHRSSPFDISKFNVGLSPKGQQPQALPRLKQEGQLQGQYQQLQEQVPLLSPTSVQVPEQLQGIQSVNYGRSFSAPNSEPQHHLNEVMPPTSDQRSENEPSRKSSIQSLINSENSEAKSTEQNDSGIVHEGKVIVDPAGSRQEKQRQEQKGQQQQQFELQEPEQQLYPPPSQTS